MTKGVCVFDIDQTLTCINECSIEQVDYMKRAVDLCHSNDFEIAINTARPPQHDILFNIPLDLRKKLEYVPVYNRPVDGPAVELQKLENMHQISNNFHVSLQNTILIDDLESTCSLLQDFNIPSILVTERNGITEKEYNILNTMICNMSEKEVHHSYINRIYS